MPAGVTLPLPGPDARSLAALGLLVVGLPVVIAAVALSLAPTAADGARVGVIVAVVLVAAGCWAALHLITSRPRITVGPHGLQVRSGPYRVHVDRLDIVRAGIRVAGSVMVNEEAPAWRSNGIAWPGYRLGWFRSRTGSRLFVVGAGGSDVVVPTHRGFVLRLGAADPAALAKSIVDLLG